MKSTDLGTPTVAAWCQTEAMCPRTIAEFPIGSKCVQPRAYLFPRVVVDPVPPPSTWAQIYLDSGLSRAHSVFLLCSLTELHQILCDSASRVLGRAEENVSGHKHVIGRFNIVSKDTDTGADILAYADVFLQGIDTMVDQIRLKDPDILNLNVDDDTCIQVIQAMKRHNYLPRGVVAYPCVESKRVQEELGEDLRFILSKTDWHPDVRHPDFFKDSLDLWKAFKVSDANTQSSPRQFRELFYEYTGAEPGFPDAALMASYAVIAGSQVFGGDFKPEDPPIDRHRMFQFTQHSFFGDISFDAFGRNNRDPIVIQYDINNTLQSPQFSARTITHSTIYPIPDWQERIYTWQFLHEPIEQLVKWLIIFSVTLSFVLMYIIIVHLKDHPAARSDSLILSMLSASSPLLIYAGILCWSLENNEFTCLARPWFLSIVRYAQI